MNRLSALGLTAEEGLENQPVGQVFGEQMFTCEDRCGAVDPNNAPLCFCDGACIGMGDCCPDACSECDVGSITNVVFGGQSCTSNGAITIGGGSATPAPWAEGDYAGVTTRQFDPGSML